MLIVATGSFAARLKELREAAGLSQYALAKKSTLTKQAISILEKGDTDPSWETILKLARALEVTVDRFDTGDDPRDLDTSEPDDTLPAPAKKPAPKKPKR